MLRRFPIAALRDAGNTGRMQPANRSDPRSRRLRTGRASIEGGIYLLTFTTLERQPHFADFDRARVACASLAATESWPHARLLAWVLMPDHWHGLVELGATDSLSRSVSRAKAAATRAWNLAHDASGSLWAAGFHDRALRKEEDLVDSARYIVLNPVRAGLAARCGEYPFWDAIWL
jgi:putative transposase